MTKFLNISTDTTLGGSTPSDDVVSSQKALKTYIDSQTGTAPAFANIVGQPSDNANLATALNAKYDASNPNGYTSNVGTVTSVNNTSPDGNGNVTITIPDALPSQTGNSGKFLTTDGTDPSWAAVDALPSQTGQSGKFLTTDGTDASWGSPDISGKADVDLSNVNSTGTALASSWAMPSSNYDDITLGASGANYTAPANGYFYFSGKSTASNQRAAIFNKSSISPTVIGTSVYTSASGQTLHVFVPCQAGDIVGVNYSTADSNALKFIYTQGEPNVQSN